MPLNPQSIRKTVSIYLNGELVEKQTVLDLSKDWSEAQTRKKHIRRSLPQHPFQVVYCRYASYPSKKDVYFPCSDFVVCSST